MGLILAAPPYLLWELFLAADPVVLPNAFVSGFRTLFYFGVFVIVIWFFIEEFIPGRNRIFELDDLHQRPVRNRARSSNQSSREQTTRSSRGIMNEDEVKSKLTEVQRQLKNDR